MRKRGQVEWATIENVSGVEFGIRFVGGRFVNRMGLELQRLRQAELKRIYLLRKEHAKDLLPEVWAEDFSTPEGGEAMMTAARTVLEECLSGIRIEGEELALDKKDLAAAAEDFAPLGDVMNLCLSKQSPSLQNSFRSSGGGNVGSGVSAGSE